MAGGSMAWGDSGQARGAAEHYTQRENGKLMIIALGD